MNEWGIPEWTDPAAYGDTEQWSKTRWRWEFTRRREDYRADFDAVCDYSVEHYRSVYSGAWAKKAGVDASNLLGPNDPGFSAVTNADQLVKYGVGLFNPRISEQQMWRLNFGRNPFRSGTAKGDGEPFEDKATVSIPDGAAAVKIDLDRPIAEQLAGARSYLEFLQTQRHGKKLQWRHHPTKWFTYLRVLDGREAGATWREIFDVVLKGQKPNNANAEQEARGVWKRARELMFNWRD